MLNEQTDLASLRGGNIFPTKQSKKNNTNQLHPSAKSQKTKSCFALVKIYQSVIKSFVLLFSLEK